jgi:hypothetical protein
LYGDVLTYSLWPGAYYDPFWAYGPDAFLSGIYWPGASYSAWSNAQYDGLYDVYGAEAPTDVGAPTTTQQATGPTSDMTVTCSGLAPGVTGLPIDRIIAQAVQPTGNQVQALDDLEIAVDSASEVVKASCPIQVPLTPLDRLDAAERRLDAMIQAMHVVRAPLERFYSTLSNAQRARLAAMAEQANGSSPAASGVTALCDPRAASFAQLPVDRIERTIQPTQQQEVAFEKLKAASTSAAASLQASCPAKAPETPVERVDAVEMRLDAMVRAAKDVRPALGAFYATLSDEQKARFNSPAFSATAAAL